MNKNILLAALVATLVGCAGAQEDTVWYADYDEAAKVAKAAGKDLLVDFTGSDWCGWCIKLDKEVFEHEAFLKPAREKFILVKLDFPRSDEAMAKVPNPERNDALSRLHGIDGFPTILLATADGVAYARTGYQAGGPEAYVGHLEKISKAGKKDLEIAIALEKEFKAAEGADALKVVEKAIEKLENSTGSEIGIQIVAKIARQAIEHDAKDEKGMKTRALRALLGTGTANEKDMEVARAIDPKNEKGLLEDVVLAQLNAIGSPEEAKVFIPKLEELIGLGIKNKDTRELITANAAFMIHRFGDDAEKAKKYATMLKGMPELPERYQRLIEEILGEN